MEPDADDVLEEGSDFSEFRHRCVELVKDVVFIVGSANVFRRMFEYLRSDAASGQWEVAEAALFVMAAVARMILPSENDVVPQVLLKMRFGGKIQNCAYIILVPGVGERAVDATDDARGCAARWAASGG